MRPRPTDPARPGWHLITSEYPPDAGGVSDYTAQLARALVAAGERVSVWSFGPDGNELDQGIPVHRRSGLRHPSGVLALAEELARLPRPCRFLIQYTPQGFGWHGLNLAFAQLLARQAGAERWVMLHEVATPWGDPLALKLNLLGFGTRLLTALVLSHADRVFVSAAGWRQVLGTFLSPRDTTWLPIPSNVPTDPPASPMLQPRRVSHFGTYQGPTAALVRLALEALLARDPAVEVVLVGGGSEQFAARLAPRDPEASGRITATGRVSAAEVARVLRSSAVALQPYPDGLSSRRTSAMAALALGVPVVSNPGVMTEPDWDGAVCLVDSEPGALAAGVLALLDDPAQRRSLGLRGRQLYQRRFALERTVSALRGAGGQSAEAGDDRVDRGL